MRSALAWSRGCLHWARWCAEESQILSNVTGSTLNEGIFSSWLRQPAAGQGVVAPSACRCITASTSHLAESDSVRWRRKREKPPAIVKMFRVDDSLPEKSAEKGKASDLGGRRQDISNPRGPSKIEQKRRRRWRPEQADSLDQPVDLDTLTLVRRKREKRETVSKEFMESLQEKVTLLKTWGVAWRSDGLNRVLNEQGEDWVASTKLEDVDSTLLQLQRAYEVSIAEVGKMVSRNPEVLKMDVDTTLRKMESFLMLGLGYPRKELSKLLVDSPEILSFDYTHMPTVIKFMRNEIGIHKQFLRLLIDKHPQILATDFETNTFQRNLAFVVMAVLGRKVSVRSLRVIPPLSHDDKCKVSKVFVQEPRLMTMENLQTTLNVLHDIGLHEWEILKICVKSPQIFPDIPKLKLELKVPFLMDICSRNYEEIFNHGSLLLKKSDEIYGRFGFLKCLGLDQMQWTYRELMTGNAEDFCKKITLTSVDSYYEFREVWVPPEEWTKLRTLGSRKPAGVEEGREAV